MLSVLGSMHEVGYYEGRVDSTTPCNPQSFYGIAKNSLRQALLLYSSLKSYDLKWLRAFYITGDDIRNHSIFTKLLQKKSGDFPFTDGKNKYDFIDIDVLADMIVKSALQSKITGIINLCSGRPVSLKDKISLFLIENHLNINLRFGVYPSRKYDSPCIYGNPDLITKILNLYKK